MKNFKKQIFFVLMVIVCLMSFSNFAFAQDTPPDPIQQAANDVKSEGLVTCRPTYQADGTLSQNCGYNELIMMINRGIKYFIFLSTFVGAGMFVWAGFLYFAAASSANPAKKEQAKKIFGSVVGGLIIIYTAWLIVYTVMTTLLDDNYKADPNINPLQPTPTSIDWQSKNDTYEA